MVAVKGKSSTNTTQIVRGKCTDKNAGPRNFKVYAENDKIKIHGPGSVYYESKMLAPAKITITQGALEELAKTNSKLDNSVQTNVGRKVLEDISNGPTNIARKGSRDSFKPAKGISATSSYFQRTSLGSGTGTESSLPGRPWAGKLRANLNQAIVESHTLKRVHAKDLKASSEDTRTKAQGPKSFNATGRTCGRNPLPAIRRSLPVFKQVNQENVENSEKYSGKNGFPVKAKISRNVVPKVSNPDSPLWKNRVSDGFILMPSKCQSKVNVLALPRKSMVNVPALPRKSIKPAVKNMVRGPNAEKSKSKCPSVLNKSVSGAATCSKTKGDTSTSLQTASLTLREAPQQDILSGSNSDLGKTMSDINGRRKSDCQKSFTSSLMTRPTLLKERPKAAEQENLPNIYDNCNHLEVTEYVDDIYQYYWVMEAQNPILNNYMQIQRDITPQMRGILINWLIEVHLKFDLMQETLFLMVTLLDKYLSLISIRKSEMQLVGLTSLLLASKYEDFWHPRVKDLLSISAESYARDQMLGMERAILKNLNFRLNMPTSYVFMLRFLKAAQSDPKCEHLSFYLIELCLVEYEALKYKSSLLCASAIYLARCTLQMTPPWTPLLSKHTHYEESHIRDCAEMILRIHKAARTTKLKVTYEKYMGLGYSKIAGIKPLDEIPL